MIFFVSGLFVLAIFAAKSGNKIANNEVASKVSVSSPGLKVRHEFEFFISGRGELKVFIEGKANEQIFAMLILPSRGEAKEKTITQIASTINSYRPISFDLGDASGKILPGTYALKVKTKNKTLHEEGILLAEGELIIKDIEFLYEPAYSGYAGLGAKSINGNVVGQKLREVKILVTKREGTLPVALDGLSLAIGNNDFIKNGQSHLDSPLMTEKEKQFDFWHNGSGKVFQKGERYTIRGRLHFGENQYAEFEREIVMK